MPLAEYKELLKVPLKQVSLCFLIKDEEILLGYKKRGLGSKKWNGIGGKPKPGEAIQQTMIRECQEEIGVKPLYFKQVALLDFYFPHNPDWNQQVVVFLVDKWEGEPSETEEVKPYWFTIEDIPYNQMWPGDIHWLPKVLNKETSRAEFLFGDDEQLLEFKVREKPGPVKKGTQIRIDGEIYEFTNEKLADGLNLWVELGMPLPFVYFPMRARDGSVAQIHATKIVEALESPN